MASPTTTLSRRRTQAPIPAPNFDDVVCQKCNSGKSPSKLLLCDKCDNGYHIFCLTPILHSVPKSSWFCPSCSHNPQNPKSFPLVQTKIIDFFKIQRTSDAAQIPNQDAKKKRKRGSSLVVSKKKRRLLAFVPSDDSNRRLEQMASLATALTATKTVFRNKLVYMAGMAPRRANDPALERGGMQVLSKEDTETLNMCRTMMERGECPPLMVVYDPLEGFTVEADKPIKDLTIITEYVGDVDFLKNREYDDGDSIMTLLTASNPSQSLVICPDKRSNIARFINGINNHTPEGKKKQNLKCVRFNVDGECRVLLIANRDIAKGERLYYDYNGLEHEYPTEHFV
ncbi:Histone-lysine N-methyltransferase atxr6 [Trifolium repens]|nr:histone-lysine N-methyltransferase ATXR6 [Trifolium repens]WJX10031.1 Histone-lysine N-methyltransferase atxr6 [Trifolium repens]